MLEQITVVLVHPKDPANIGAVCRSMKNMGLTRLVIVGRNQLLEKRIKLVALHAWDIYEDHTENKTLEEALSTSVLSAGFTRRQGRFRKYFSIGLQDLVSRISLIKSGTVALVFGNEAHGLTDAELGLCNCSVRIPTSSLFPSLNLSHAVQIAAYELFKFENRAAGGEITAGVKRASSEPGRRFEPITRDRMDILVSSITADLKGIGFFTLTGEEDTKRFLRDILMRAYVEQREAERLERMFHKMRDLKLHRS